MTVNNENNLFCSESYLHKIGFDTMNYYLIYCYCYCCLYQNEMYYRNVLRIMYFVLNVLYKVICIIFIKRCFWRKCLVGRGLSNIYLSS